MYAIRSYYVPQTGVFSLTPDRILKSWSATSARLFGWTKEEAIGRSLPELFPGQVDSILEGLDALECAGRFNTNLLLKTRDGKEIGVRVIVLSLCDVERILHQYTFLIYPLT